MLGWLSNLVVPVDVVNWILRLKMLRFCISLDEMMRRVPVLRFVLVVVGNEVPFYC